jgi:hypothetical protein
MIETAPLEQAAAAYAKMMAGKARFRMVLIVASSEASSRVIRQTEEVRP